jgi:hypothetical protein
MGVTKTTLDFVNQWLKPEYKSVCEFGDQQFMYCFPQVESSYCSTYYKSKKLKYASIDMNEQGGALGLDLNKPIIEQGLSDKFDFLTDFGTLEHVNDFYMGFKNMHDLCNKHGTMLHILPANNYWLEANGAWHGTWRGTLKFFRKLGKAQGYNILRNVEDPSEFSLLDGRSLRLPPQIFVAFEKIIDNEFISREIFEECEPLQVGPLEDSYNQWPAQFERKK